MPENVFFTVVANNYDAHARVLMQSVKRHHPEAKRYIILCDRLSDEGVTGEFAKIICVDDLQIPNLTDMKLRYDVMELSTAVKPFSFLFLELRHPGSHIIYLDPDILVTAPLVHVDMALDNGAELVLTPHLTAPLDDGRQPDDLAIMKSGIYNLGFAAFRIDRESRKLLEWWRDRCKTDAIVDIAENKFTDQRWMDMAPAFVKKTHILHHHSYNLAYWNLSHRKVTKEGDDYYVDGEALRFVHFSGINPESPENFSKHQNRFQSKDIGDLQFLFSSYIEALLAHGWRKTHRLPYAFNYFENGRKIHKFMRSAFRRHALSVDAKFVMRDGGFFDEPDLSLDCEGFPKVTVLMHELWRRRPDLMSEFNLIKTDDQKKFVDWFLGSAAEQEGVDEISIAAAKNLLRPRSGRKPVTPWAPQLNEAGPLNRSSLAPWLAEPISVNILLATGAPPIPRHLALLWEERADLRSHFPCQSNQDLWAFFLWCITDGANQRSVDPALIAPSLENFLDFPFNSPDVHAPPVTRLLNCISPLYSRSQFALDTNFPDARTNMMAKAIWLIGKASSNYNWPSSFTRRQREWSQERSQECLTTEVPISNLMFAMWRLRPDIQTAFHLRDKASQTSFLGWLICYGMREFDLPIDTLPKVVFEYLGKSIWLGVNGAMKFHLLCRERRMELHKFSISNFKDREALVRYINSEPSSDQWGATEWLNAIRKVTANSTKSNGKNKILRIFYSKNRQQNEGPYAESESVTQNSVLLTGLKFHTSGRGEDLRLTAQSLKVCGVQFDILDRFNENQKIWKGERPERGVNIVHLNAETAHSDYLFLRRAGVAGCRTVGYWAWELAGFPNEWRHAFAFYDEIWASTDFAYESFSSSSNKPVVKVPMAVRTPEIDRALTRTHFAIPDSAFIFFFSFDFRSYVARKNPFTVVAAFKAAFPDPSSGVVLFLKTLGGRDHPGELKALIEYAGQDKRIIIRDIEYSGIELASLVNLCDCFVSLHRSEGFGRGPAEAMLLGKPVIATAYSGNMDYMDDSNSCLVDYKLISVKAGEYPGYQNQVWADPNVDHATYWMAKIAEDATLAKRLGERAKLRIEELYAPEVVGLSLDHHLKRLSGS